MVKATKTELVTVDVSSNDLLDSLAVSLANKEGVYIESLDIRDGIKYHYECTGGHNNDWEWVELGPASEREIELFDFWQILKGVVN